MSQFSIREPGAIRLNVLPDPDWLNRACFCQTLDRASLEASVPPGDGVLFADVPVYLRAADLDRIGRLIQAVEAAALVPAYQEAALAWAPAIARLDPGPRAAFMGYDFHIGPHGPRLIEINTNAGGAYLSALASGAQTSCCAAVETSFGFPAVAGFGAEVIEMFRAEFALQRGEAPLRRVAIVDDEPEDQFLFAEFELAQRLFEASGIEAVIVDPRDLARAGGRLLAGDRPVDLVYNRLVDFALEEARHEVLRQAYLAGEVVLTPNPRAHALLADKRNLTLLSDPAFIAGLDLAPGQAAALADIPGAARVRPEAADELWARRRKLFFKPANGHGSKAVYRGDKLTRGVWSAILAADYVAQDLVAPSERAVDPSGRMLKADIRVYAYAGRPLLAAARLYQGQTTNFRTPGGGFAAVAPV